MTPLTVPTKGSDATEAVGEALGALLQAGDLVVLTGELGAGKTTLAKGLARGLGVTQPVTSPTFTIVQEYEGRVPVAHVDVYRLERIQELHDLGFEELLEGRVTVVEWGEAIDAVLPRDRLEIRILLTDDDDRRVLECTAAGPSWAARRDALERALAEAGAR